MIPRGSENGSTLVLNVLVMTVFAMTAVVVYAAAKSQVKAVVRDAREAQALAIAEAGLEDAMHGIYLDPLWRTGFNQKPFAGGYYTVSLSSSNPPYIVSTGYSSSMLLTGRAVKTVAGQVEFTAGACPYAVMAAGNGGGAAVVIDGSADAYDITTTLTPSATEFTTGATVRSNKSVSVGGAACPPAHIRGDVIYVTGGPSAACVTGTITSTTQTLTVADFPEPATNDNAVAGKITPSSAYSGGVSQKLDVNAGQTVSLASGTYVFKQVNIAGTGVLNVLTSSGTVSVYLKNNFTASSGCQINNVSKIPSRFHFYGINGGNQVRLTCSTPLHAYLEGSQSNFLLEQELYGHFCSDKVDISSTTGAVGKLHYDLGGGGLVSHVKYLAGSWTESYKRQ